MTPYLLPLLQCPRTRAPLRLSEAEADPSGNITMGWLISTEDPRCRYPIIRGIPRLLPEHAREMSETVASFGEQWNYFEADNVRLNFEHLTVPQTFGGMLFFKDKMVVDAGAGSGLQSRAAAEAGAAHVIALDLSNAVDGVIAKNLAGFSNVDIIQCSLDAVPLRDDVVEGVVMCLEAIHHTPSVERTARELWRITAPGSEMAFNCYLLRSGSPLRAVRHRLYLMLRELLASLPFSFRLAYAHAMSALRFVPVLGSLLEAFHLVRRGPLAVKSSGKDYWRNLYRLGVLHTFDYYGSHAFQHHLSPVELHALVERLSPKAQMLNAAQYFSPKHAYGLLLRLKKS